jgi:hypothetical protein
MVNFEKSIMKAMPKIRKEYLKEWNKEVHNDIYVDVDRIDIMYEGDSTWADVTIAWGREDQTMPLHYSVTIGVYPRHLKYIVGYILGVMQYEEDESI